MKTLIALFAAVLFSSASAQITLEHDILDSNEQFTLIQVDSGEYYYMTYFFGSWWEHDGVDFKLYDLNYNLVKEIDCPGCAFNSKFDVFYITRRLFDSDDSLEYLYYNEGSSGFNQLDSVQIFKESGTKLFSCDSCSFRGIHTTPNGVKMLIMKHDYIGKPAVYPRNSIYSLPGKLPTSSVAVEDIAYIKSALDIQATPNPASDRIEINYQLPAGAHSGYIAIRDTKGAELQTHPLNFTEGSISVDVRSLSPGSYYCCLLTSDGRTTVKKMMVVR